jgi:hypothetical protein
VKGIKLNSSCKSPVAGGHGSLRTLSVPIDQMRFFSADQPETKLRRPFPPKPYLAWYKVAITSGYLGGVGCPIKIGIVRRHGGTPPGDRELTKIPNERVP